MYYRMLWGTWCKYISVGQDRMNVFAADFDAAAWLALLRGTGVPLNRASHPAGLSPVSAGCGARAGCV